MSQHPDVAYLKKDEIGLVISKGLASLYEARPKNPVDFLGKWLLSYAKEQKLQKESKAHGLYVKELKKKHKEQVEKQEKKQKKELKKEEERLEEIENFYKMLDRSDDFYDLLPDFVQFLLKHTDSTGVYIAEMEQQKNKIDESSDENAHFNAEGPKSLRYRFVSKGHEQMIDQHLKPDEGVTFDIFKEKEAEGEKEGEEAGEGEAQEAEKAEEKGEEEEPHLFVQDIVREPRMKFFQVPRLGSYLAIPLNYENCEFEASFDKGLTNHYECQEKRAQQREDKEKYEEEMKEKRDAHAESGAEEPFVEEKKVWEEIQEDEFESVLKQFAICLDSSGQDRKFTDQQRKFALNAVKTFREKWEQCQKDNLKKDIRSKVQMTEDEKDYKTSEEEGVIEEEEKKAVDEHLAIKEELDEEHKAHEIEVAKFNFQAKYMGGADFKKKVGVLCGFKVMKYRKIWQSLCYLLGYKREEICFEDTNMLEWKKTKLIFKKDFYTRLTGYTPLGAKEGDYLAYQKIGWIDKNIAEYTTEEAEPLIEQFSVALWKLYLWLRKAIELRMKDYEARVQEIKDKREEREEKIKQSLEEHAAMKEEAMQAAKLEFDASQEGVEEKEEFNAEEWGEKWDEGNAPPEPPKEIEDYIDNDIEKEAVPEEA